MRRSTRRLRTSGGGGAFSACRRSAKNHASLEKKQKSLEQQMKNIQEELKPLYAEVNRVSHSLARSIKKKPQRSPFMEEFIKINRARQAREAAQAAEPPKRSAVMQMLINKNKERRAREAASQASSHGGRRRSNRRH